MKTDEMRTYLINLATLNGICDETHHYITIDRIHLMTPEEIEILYNLCYPNYGELDWTDFCYYEWEG